MASSPSERSLKVMRERGYRAAVVERWNPHARIRQDLFGCVDLLCIGNGETVAVQATSASNVSSRIRKLEDSEALADMRNAGWRILVHGWKRASNGRWMLREEDIS